MASEQDALKQLEADKAAAEGRADALAGQVLALQGDISAIHEQLDKQDKAIEKLGASILAFIGKDGIKVAFPNIGLDTGVLGAIQALSQQTPNDTIAVNLIVNGVEQVETFVIQQA